MYAFNNNLTLDNFRIKNEKKKITGSTKRNSVFVLKHFT